MGWNEFVQCEKSANIVKGINRNWCLGSDMDHLPDSTAELHQGGRTGM